MGIYLKHFLHYSAPHPNYSTDYLYMPFVSLKDKATETLNSRWRHSQIISRLFFNCLVLQHMPIFGKDKYSIDPPGKTDVIQTNHHQGAIMQTWLLNGPVRLYVQYSQRPGQRYHTTLQRRINNLCIKKILSKLYFEVCFVQLKRNKLAVFCPDLQSRSVITSSHNISHFFFFKFRVQQNIQKMFNGTVWGAGNQITFTNDPIFFFCYSHGPF